MNKYIIALVVLIFTCVTAFAQNKVADLEGINYQAVAFDDKNHEIVGVDVVNKPLYEKEIGIRFSITDGPSGSITYYEEEQVATTNKYGMFEVTIGLGDVTGGDYSKILDIPWINGDQWLMVEISKENNGSYKQVNYDKLMAVPFAYYTDDIADNAITTHKIVDEAILSEDINTGAVETSEILDETILAEDIGSGSVRSDEILDETILSQDIANGAIQNEDIADGTIDLTGKVTGILPVANGGTGTDGSSVTNGQILVGDASNGRFVPTNIVAGDGIEINESAGAITISSPPISATVGSDGTFTIPVGSNGVISGGASWESPSSLQIPPVEGKTFEMGDLFLASANVDLKGCLLSVYLQSVTGGGDAKLKVVIFNPKATDVTLDTPVTFKFLLVK
jgi:hypothetical protein